MQNIIFTRGTAITYVKTIENNRTYHGVGVYLLTEEETNMYGSGELIEEHADMIINDRNGVIIYLDNLDSLLLLEETIKELKAEMLKEAEIL